MAVASKKQEHEENNTPNQKNHLIELFRFKTWK
jgi:hypothetical protein